ncbi:MAG TPA: zinc-dependent metalloprotease [Arthrobacter sp.]|nr:zinc-dependent metalloprotease [Arthrobacter sp.]
MDANKSPNIPSLVNWELAANTAARLTPAGPRMPHAEITEVVANLRELADQSVGHVHRITKLDAARDLRDSELLVVDRASWSKASTQSFRSLLQPTLDELARTRADQLNAATAALGGTVTGAQMGTILAFLSSKVLGQYDPFAESSAGRLLLVAPNIVAVQQELNVDAQDFRLWVCLHEQTHRVQFAAAPWLKDHMREQIGQLTSGLMDKADTLAERLGAAARNLGRSAKAVSSSNDDETGPDPGQAGPGGVLSVIQDPQDQAILSHLTAVMSLLEGHANVVMDAVGPDIVPTVKTIRQRFNARGKNRGALEKWIRHILGLDAKMRQYSDGSRFVRAVVDKVGMEGFNRVWESPDCLPTEEEIHNSSLWIARMGL